MNVPTVDFIHVTKSYGENTAVSGITFSLDKGEILALVGPSGCGKSTLLRLVAGFETCDQGEIYLDGRLVSSAQFSLPPERRGAGLIFQEYALFPHLSVRENVAYGLHRHPRPLRKTIAGEFLSLVGLEGYSNRYPGELSGGERQRVALARALAPEPLVLLLDEPFSSLDADLRIQLREEVRGILKRTGATAIFVTHDQEEALAMGDRMAVMHRGRLEQIGTPEEVFHGPKTRFVAEFMGQTDLLQGVVTSEGIRTEIGTLPQWVNLPEGAEVEVAVRFDDLRIDPHAGLPLRIEERQFKGAHNRYTLRLPSGRRLHIEQPHTDVFFPGTTVPVALDPGHPLACFSQDEVAEILSSHFASTGTTTADGIRN